MSKEEGKRFPCDLDDNAQNLHVDYPERNPRHSTTFPSSAFVEECAAIHAIPKDKLNPGQQRALQMNIEYQQCLTRLYDVMKGERVLLTQLAETRAMLTKLKKDLRKRVVKDVAQLVHDAVANFKETRDHHKTIDYTRTVDGIVYQLFSDVRMAKMHVNSLRLVALQNVPDLHVPLCTCTKFGGFGVVSYAPIAINPHLPRNITHLGERRQSIRYAVALRELALSLNLGLSSSFERIFQDLPGLDGYVCTDGMMYITDAR